MIPCGYAGKVLRVNLSKGMVSDEQLDADLIRQYIGGAGFGARYLYEENPDGIEWSDPKNRMILANGPLSGTAVRGSGTMCVTSKGPMTNLAGISQSNGYWGAFLKSCGYDGIVIHGCADRWSYLFISEGKAELRDATHLQGKDTYETQELIRAELGIKGAASIHCIGPAAENKVRFSVITGDATHVVSKNGLGAVLGSKRLKAIAICRGKYKARIHDEELLKKVAKELYERSFNDRDRQLHKYGTNGSFSVQLQVGSLPVRNYTTNLFPEHEKMNGQYVRGQFEKVGRNTCFNCGMHHLAVLKVTEGPYKGFVGEDPEYEAFAALGPQIGQTDAGAVFVLSDNETGWVIGWLMECYEKGILTKKDTDGIEMNWGNVESTRKILEKISNREGIGNLLAEGVKRASEEIGGEAADMAVCTRKGSTPRGHDHRCRWSEILDTCLGNTSTIEATFGGAKPELLGMPPIHDRFSPWEASSINAMMNGWHIFEDCVGVCRFNMRGTQSVIDTFNAATGFNLSLPEVMKTGKRIVHVLRAFNLRNGLTSDIEAPGTRYASTPTDGPGEGIGIAKHWDLIREIYYRLMGWDSETGIPLPKTLRDLGLEDVEGKLSETGVIRDD
jgi:aldehyde:ferredoxin oxidoreductase